MKKEKPVLTATIKKYGYQYNLVEAPSERSLQKHLPEPCFMGKLGYVLQSFHKIEK
jgi:hypothetical protein